MSVKLKIILGILILTAGFFVIRLGLFFRHNINTSATANISNSLTQAGEENAALKDSDNDGIPDIYEAYYRTNPFNPDTDGDGFLDGEEIASNHDPTKKDKPPVAQNTENNNITHSLAERFVGGLLAGDLNPRNGTGLKFNQGMDTLALAAIEDAGNTLTPPGTNNIPISLSEDSKEAQEEYLKEVSVLLDGPFLDIFMAQPQTLNNTVQLIVAGKYEEASKIFQEHQIMFINAFTSLAAISVPPKWLNFHKQLLAIFQKIELDYGAAIKISDDPILSLTAIADLINPLTEVQSLIQKLRDLVVSQGLNVPKTPLFDVLNLLGN